MSRLAPLFETTAFIAALALDAGASIGRLLNFNPAADDLWYGYPHKTSVGGEASATRPDPRGPSTEERPAAPLPSV